MANPWSKVGVAEYPPRYPMVGQNGIFNGLWKFKQGFSNDEELSGFFAVVGDWGLGKTRLGYELIAETKGHIDEWVLNNAEYVVPNTNFRILEPQLQEGILPLFTDYKSVIDEELAVETWVPKLTCDALSFLWKRPKDLRVTPELLDDMAAVLKAKGVELSDLESAMERSTDWKNKLENVMDILRPKGIRHLWVIVDEVEMPGDMKKRPDYDPKDKIDIEDLELISVVIKEKRYREDHPYVNFLLLCSLGMSDTINIGPNRRRSELIILEPNQINDVIRYKELLEESGETVDYPNGTLEGAFIATNRIFGWFNKMMSSIHSSWTHHKGIGKPLPVAWNLIEEYARAEARSNEIFDLRILDTMPTTVKELQYQMVFGQLPMEVGPDLTADQAEKLMSIEAPGVGAAFASLKQIHIDSETLANELIKPEHGFKRVERPGDEFQSRYTEFSVSGVLSALCAFSVSVTNTGDFVIYEDIEQFAEQLSTLYPRESADESKNIERAAEPLYQIFKQYAVKDRKFVGVSFRLLKGVNVKMSGESRGVAFSRDAHVNEEIDQYFDETIKSGKQRSKAICIGMAKVIDDHNLPLRQITGLDHVQHVAFESEFKSPMLEGFCVTRNGRVTAAYCDDIAQTCQELGAMLGRSGETVHPILVLMGPDGDEKGLTANTLRKPLLSRSVVIRKLSRFEQDFLIRYSGRDKIFDTAVGALSSSTHATLGQFRDDLRSTLDSWRRELDTKGYLLRPIWYRKQTGAEDFYRGYQHMLATGKTIDQVTTEIPGSIFEGNTVAYDNLKNACNKNVLPGPAFPQGCLPILDSDPLVPVVCPAMVRMLQEMVTQTSEQNLAKRFFFAVRDTEVKGKQENQFVEFLAAMGIVVSPSPKSYKAISKEVLEERRTVVSNWVTNTASDLIKEIKLTFPTEAGELRKGFKAQADSLLKKAEQIYNRIDITFLQSDTPDINEFQKLVGDVYEFENVLKQICPQEPNHEPEISETQINDYQNNYKNLSFWEKVHLLRWLQKIFSKKHLQITKDIDEVLTDLGDYSAVQGKPFPITPASQPLKDIKGELDNALTPLGGSLRKFLELDDFPLALDSYLHTREYDMALGRVNALSALASKKNPKSLWQNFINLAADWKEAVIEFEKAQILWNDLYRFMKDAPSKVWSGTTGLRQTYEDLNDLVEGGLKHLIDQYAVTNHDLKPMERLKKEIDESSQTFRGLGRKIKNFREDIEETLMEIISDDRLQALNRLLRADKEKEWHVPKIQETYGTTKTELENFNLKVSENGKNRLEGTGYSTNWELWVEIFIPLRDGKYKKKSEHDANFDELEKIGVIERTIKLR